MGVSLYYTVRRSRPLTSIEQIAIDTIAASYPVSALTIELGIRDGEYGGEAFCVYPLDKDTEPGVIFEGATKLPLCSEGAFWAAIQYWCRLLSEVRRVLPGADWHVHIDDYDITWDEESFAFDPSVS